MPEQMLACAYVSCLSSAACPLVPEEVLREAEYDGMLRSSVEVYLYVRSVCCLHRPFIYLLFLQGPKRIHVTSGGGHNI